jgi:hypothetical protein
LAFHSGHAPPSWTLRTLGHEGTRCWHAGPRRDALAQLRVQPSESGF